MGICYHLCNLKLSKLKPNSYRFPRKMKGKYMYSKVLSAFIKGVSIELVDVECDISSGLPIIDMVGLLASDVKEAKNRVRTALKNADIFLPPKRITINLSPANVRKQGNIFDLPIALTMLASLGIVEKGKLEGVLVMGELGLDGSVNSVNGVLPVIAEAKKMGVKNFIVPLNNIEEGKLVAGVKIAGVSSILEAIDVVNKDGYVLTYGRDRVMFGEDFINCKDFIDVCGQESVKRAVMVAAAGMHNILMVGAPGTGKTMIAERIPYILPKPSIEECLEITKIQSIVGELQSDGLVMERPFRAPHHTISKMALIGGGNVPHPGEITKAHGGVLFLDELAEFKSETLDTLRQPLENERVVINRNNGNYIFPASCMLVTATNPCKCGYYPDRNKCSCSDVSVSRYINRISGPMLDRMDIWIFIPKVDMKNVQNGKCMSSKEMYIKIENARKIQEERYKDSQVKYNGKLSGKDVLKYCKLGKKEKEFLQSIFESKGISYRGYYKIIKLARTIADLEGCEEIGVAHLAEAAGYRNEWRSM